MPVTISGTSGVQLPLGSASAPSATNTTAQTTGVYYPTSTTLGLSTNGTNAVYVDASQNVGIGTTSPATLLHVNGSGPVLRVSDSVGTDVAQLNARNSTANSTWGVDNSSGSITGTANAAYWYNFANTPSVFFTNATERARIDTSGNLLMGTTSNQTTSHINVTATSSVVNGFGVYCTTTSNTGALIFVNPNGVVGSIQCTGSSTAYNTSSDYRLKENVQPMTTGLAKISALKPVTYDWISDKSHGEGFIAHELQSVIPLAVSGEKDAVNEDGSINAQGVDYSKIVVHLVAAVQELSAKVDAQAAEIAALKAKVPA